MAFKQYKSSRRKPKLNPGDIPGIGYKEEKKRTYKESDEQSTIASYIKWKYPNIMFETVEREGARSKYMQSRIKKINSNSGWPDTRIYESRCGYHSLMIENKHAGVELFQKRNARKFTTETIEHQYVCHRGLIQRGHAVYFAIGVDEAIDTLERYLSGNPPPFLEVDYTPHIPGSDVKFFEERGL